VVVAIRGDVDDPEPDLRLRDAAPVSRLTHSGISAVVITCCGTVNYGS
jgi:hypothetical protein